MSYTMKQVDLAIIHVLGKDVFAALTAAHSAGRVGAHDMAITKAFMNKIDNQFTDILRESMFDLSKTGMYKPNGGFND